MENVVCLDASTLIDYYRKKIKEKTFFYSLTFNYEGFVLPVTAHFEVLIGSNEKQYSFWNNLFSDLLLIPYQSYDQTAILILRQLKKLRKNIEYKDLMIASTARHYNYPLATINEKHFEAIEGLKLTPSSFNLLLQ